MIKQFLHINQRRIIFLTLVSAGTLSIGLWIALLIARVEIPKPISETLLPATLFTLAAFTLFPLTFFINGIVDLKKSRKLFDQANWKFIYDKYGFQRTILDQGKFMLLIEAKQGNIHGFNIISFVNLKHKAIQFVFLGNDNKNGVIKPDEECNCNLQFTNLQMDIVEIEKTIQEFISEIKLSGITASQRTHL